MINFTIQHEKYVGIRLDKFLVSNLSEFSRSKIQNNIRLGKVLVNGLKCKTGYLIQKPGKFGLFLGCSNYFYNDCDYTRNIDK